MNHVMWSHPAVQANLGLLAERGVRVLGPASGDQACGETGPGRMVEPTAIADAVTGEAPASSGPLAGRRVLITAGPTREAIDPVRYITNRSSGKMGYALARAAREAGAEVLLVSGPVNLATPYNVERIDVESAADMYKATHRHIGSTDIFIGAAAVADYSAAAVSDSKIKKSQGEMSLELARTQDILASVASLDDGPFTVGFAAETDHLADHAKSKLEKKSLDMIIANEVGPNRGFDSDDNTVEVFWPGGGQSFPTMAKTRLAMELVRLIATRYAAGAEASRPGHLSAVASGD
jgi:phosphopantothenoylcysteine decarboxylase/phosphopantothenate--cysteine ligase